MHDCLSVHETCFLPESGRRWYTTPDDGRQGSWGRRKTDVMRDWEWKAGKRGNMIEKEASTGMEAWMGFASLAQRQDLTWGIHQSISTGGPNFCSWVVCDYWESFLQLGLFCSSDLLYFLCLARPGESQAISLKLNYNEIKIILWADVCGDCKT